MSIERYTNAPVVRTTLNGGIDNSTTTVVVADGSVFPSSGIFRIIIDTEIMKVTSRSTNTLTVTRADGSSSAASHSSGATVRQIVTKEAIERANTVIAKALAYASIDAAAEANEGWLNFPTDVPKILRSDGSAWRGFGPAFPLNRPPDPAGMTWVNQGTSTASLVRETVYMKIPATASDQFRLLVKSIPSSPYTVTMLCTPYFGGDDFVRAGMCIRESSSGKFTHFGYETNNIKPDSFMVAMDWTNPTTFSSNVTGGTAVTDRRLRIYAPNVFFRIRDNNTDLFFEYSADYETWHLLGTRGRTTFLTADQIGFSMEGFNGSNPNAMTVWSWLEE